MNRMDRVLSRAAGLAIVVAVVVSATVGAEDDLAPAQIATDFAQGFFEARDADIGGLMTPQVKAAMTKTQSDQLRAGLANQNGAFKRAGPGWFEDKIQGFRRYRVPLEFAKATVDMRVVLDGAGKVAGMFFVPHVDRPREDAEPEAPVTPGIPRRGIEEFEVEVGDPALPGTISRPAGDGPFPAVVLVHGSGPNDRDETVGPNKPFRDLAWGLAQQGVLVLRYDKRSYARPDDLAAVGKDLTVRQEVLVDARAALDVLRARADADSDRLYVLGHSLGGTVAPRIAAEDPRPAGLIVLAGSTLPLPEKMLEQTRYILERSGDTSDAAQNRLEQIAGGVKKLRQALNGEIADPEGYVLGAPVGYFRDLEAHDPPAIAAKLGLPVLVLQGKRDYQVTMRDFERWQAALTGRDGACLTAYDDLDHLFRKGTGASTPADYERKAPVDARVIRDIAAWIAGGSCPS